MSVAGITPDHPAPAFRDRGIAAVGGLRENGAATVATPRDWSGAADSNCMPRLVTEVPHGAPRQKSEDRSLRRREERAIGTGLRYEQARLALDPFRHETPVAELSGTLPAEQDWIERDAQKIADDLPCIERREKIRVIRSELRLTRAADHFP